jgi:hypothetical protein
MRAGRLIVLASLIALWTPARGQAEAPRPIVVASLTDGMEVVIQARPDKLATLGMKWEELRKELRYRRLEIDNWKVEIQRKEMDLGRVAKIEVRKLKIPPFTVTLPDGRELLVTPVIAKIGGYRVTGEYFEESVRELLADLFLENPLKVRTLGGIANPGNSVPWQWGPSPGDPRGHVARSIGQPLNQLAKLELRGKTGPLLVDLERMRAIRRAVTKTVAAERNTPRTDFERHFGVVKSKKDTGWIYPLAKGRIQLFFDDEPKVVSWIYYLEPAAPTPKKPRDLAHEARTIAQMDRDFLFVFLQRKATNATPAEMAQLRKFLQKTESVLKWTPAERRQLLGAKLRDE